MRVLIWRNYKEIRNRKIQIAILGIFPIIYYLFFYFNGCDVNILVSFYPLVVTLFGTVLHFSISNIISSEQLLATTLSIKKIWKSNLFWVLISGYIYSSLILVIFSLFMGQIDNLRINAIIEYIFNIFLAGGFIGLATSHYADYGFFKQVIASIFSVVNILCPIIFLFMYKKIILNYKLNLITIIVALLACIISYFIILKSNKEKLIINTSKLVTKYDNTIEE